MIADDDESNEQVTCVQHLITGSLSAFHGDDTQHQPYIAKLSSLSPVPPTVPTSQTVSLPPLSRDALQ